jgi:hypothetical protein
MTARLVRIALAFGVVGALGLALVTAAAGSQASAKRSKFQFALIGDLPYTPEQIPPYESVIEEINASRVAFTIHDGDIKSGSTRCDNDIYYRERDRLDNVEPALVYTPGDNEWTDCHRANNGAYDPLERLAFLRATMYPDPDRSLGTRPIKLDYQNDDYPENVRWQYQSVTFASLHIVGSNNNLGRNAENDAEYTARNAANLEWLGATFAAAEKNKSAAILLAIQANPFEGNTETPSGFDDFVEVLRTKIIAFDKPVVLVHGDSHYFRIDKPLLMEDGASLPNFTRVETFGSPNVHWLRAEVDTKDPEVFTFEQEIVEAP